jgi:Fe-S-cluster containining protein
LKFVKDGNSCYTNRKVPMLELNIAKISFDPKIHRITNIAFIKSDLRFRCQRCAVFCCKLGAPSLSKSDMKRLKQADYRTKDFIDATSIEDSTSGDKKNFLKHKEDGSCIFLQKDKEAESYACGIYKNRPSLCRLYPFEFVPTGLSAGILRLIPCCNGLNIPDGDPVDRRFIEKNLLEAIINSLKRNPKLHNESTTPI